MSSFTYSPSRILICAIAFTAIAAPQSHAATLYVNGGSVAMSFDETVFANLFLSTIDHFVPTTANSLDLATIANPAKAGDSTGTWSNLDFGINPSTLSSPVGRGLQGTNLSYDSTNFAASITGLVGLGGFTRFNGVTGVFYIGDFQLLYNADRAAASYSGWYLVNTAGFPANAFDLANVSTTVTANGFSLSGDLVPNIDSFFALYGLAGTKMGDFSLSASAVPEVSSTLLGVVAFAGYWTRRRRHK